MATAPQKLKVTRLERLQEPTLHSFFAPVKCINDGDDLNFFLSSTGYRDLTLWLLQLNRSMFPTPSVGGEVDAPSLQSPPASSANVQDVQSTLQALEALLEQAPPSTGPRRFGNIAFRDWHKLAEAEAPKLIRAHLSTIIASTAGDDAARSAGLVEELRSYLLGSFGSGQRLDYGTGHELSFLAFLGCLWKLGAFEEGEERAMVMCLVQPYLELVRKLISTYTLEPAGSHGVWGLDDHNFVPYIFGSAQFGPPIPLDHAGPVPTEGSLPQAPSPASVTKKERVLDYKDSNMYFSAIQFIYDVKKGPFWEHSPILYDISGLKDGWGKINKGMLKMYAAEVLGKFPVVQHFPFGSLFRWEADPSAINHGGSVHAQAQPQAVSKDVPVPGPGPGVGTAAPWAKSGGAGGVGTAAPWAKPGGSSTYAIPAMPASTGVPSTRAPWAEGATIRPSQPATSGAAGQRLQHPHTSYQPPR